MTLAFWKASTFNSPPGGQVGWPATWDAGWRGARVKPRLGGEKINTQQVQGSCQAIWSARTGTLFLQNKPAWSRHCVLF